MHENTKKATFQNGREEKYQIGYIAIHDNAYRKIFWATEIPD